MAAAAMVAVVLATGFVGNSLSDQLFDLDGLRIGFQIFERRELVAIPPDSSYDPFPDLPGLRAEDALKQDVALDLCRAQSVGSEARLQLASRVTPNGAKQLRQDAAAFPHLNTIRPVAGIS